MGRINHHAIDNGDVKVSTSEFPVEYNSEPVPYPDTTPNKSIGDDEIDHLLEFFHEEHDEDLIDVDLQMIQDWLAVAPPSKFYTVYTVLFHKHGGANYAVTEFISHFSMFVPTKATVKLANVKTVHTQLIGIILCYFPNYLIIYLVGPVHYFPSRPYNTILLEYE